MANVQNLPPFPVDNGKFNITDPESQRPGARVFLSNLDTGTYVVGRLGLGNVKAKFPDITWLTAFQVGKRQQSQPPQQVSFTVEIDLGVTPPAGTTFYTLLDVNSTPQPVPQVNINGTTISFPMNSADPMIGMG